MDGMAPAPGGGEPLLPSGCSGASTSPAAINGKMRGTAYAVVNLGDMQSNSPIIEIAKALRQTFWEIAREPVPERWIDLIVRLDAEEAQRGNQHDEEPYSPRSAAST